MGKKRIIEKGEQGGDSGLRSHAAAKSGKLRLSTGILHVQSSFNNTKLLVTDGEGNAVLASSSGALGFKGAKKGTPFAAAKVGFGQFKAATAQAAGANTAQVVTAAYHGSLVPPFCNAAARGFFSQF